MADRAEAIKQELIDQACELVQARVQPAERELVEQFIRRYFRDVSPADLLETEPLDLYGAALAHLRFGTQRHPDQSLVRVYNPTIEQHGWRSRHTIIEIVHDDMPFLVDSTAMEINRHGLAVHLTIHPVLPVGRDEGGRIVSLDAAENGRLESFMHVEIDRLTEPATLEALERALAEVLIDVRDAVADWQPMLERVEAAIQGLQPAGMAAGEEEIGELVAFLRWLTADHFTFLGYLHHTIEAAPDGPQLRRSEGSGLGINRGQDRGLSRSFAELDRAIRQMALDPANPLIVTKANTKSTVHRATYLDVVVVKAFSPDGKVTGQHRFLGLFTSNVYSLSPRQVPLLRRKVETVLRSSGFAPSGHAGKALAHILESYPRDELFQISIKELTRIALGILQLQERQRVRVFLRRDPFDRFVTCLVFLPRERYTTSLRERLQGLLEQVLGSGESEFQVQLGESVLARLFFLVRTPASPPADLDHADLERRIVEASYSWTDRLRSALIEAAGEAEGNRLLRTYGHGMPVAYQEAMPARAAVPDIRQMDRLDGVEGLEMALSLFRRLEEPEDVLHFKVIRADEPVHLSEALPLLENMGLKVLIEHAYETRSAGGRSFRIHDFTVRPTVGAPVEVDDLREIFQDAFRAIWSGRAENDGFNRLVLTAGLSARQIGWLRAYCRYLLQLQLPFSQAYVEQTLVSNPGPARLLVELFQARFDPAGADRDARQAELRQRIERGLEAVASLDEDRIIRAYLGLIEATLRTNAFQKGPDGGFKDYVSFKLDPSKVPGMPLPRPLYEIWVYAPYVEAVHLRGGRVGRGGIRWSDRREDFRTEVLSLLKAQMVKNGVIVPVGAKGGFFVKRPPDTADRAAQQQEAIRCYRTFLSGMLDITDNRVGTDVVPPADVVRHDGDDPYLVVAADKGTATFSDIANAISRDYGFWLDDAFASGGSAGYDHKKIGITARGAWQSLRRHARELGVDPAEDVFTCVGIGDMSGDVFGNGMLQSDRMKLVAAFDHRHVFIDPDPDPLVSFAERRRLFDLPRSSWADYDVAKISPGGGVFARTLKSVTVSPEAQRALGFEKDRATPAELINAILKAPVDLLWNGGIGTYVKASDETHAEAHDRSNDAVRADAAELRARVVVEGGNLGFTQKARVEYALAGGRINTDFIDNSAGVDCSDHEVNIKILLNHVVKDGDLTLKHRDELLAAMTDEVAQLVIRDNILQNMALSMASALGTTLVDPAIRLMRKLERAGQLDRQIEMLPTDEELEERRRGGVGLTRPETAVLIAYAKLTLYDRLLESELPDRSYFVADLLKYFPRPLRRRFRPQIEQHRLRRELIATLVANSLVNRGLHVFVSELEDDTGAPLEDLALAFVTARDGLALLPLYAAVEDLPRSVPAELQLELFLELRDTLRLGTRWFLAHAGRPIVVRRAVAEFQPQIARIVAGFDDLLSDSLLSARAARRSHLIQHGVEPELAGRLADLQPMLAAADIVLVDAEARDRQLSGDDGLERAARVHFAFDEALALGWLKERLVEVPLRTRWDRIAVTNLDDQIAAAHRRITLTALTAGVGDGSAAGTRGEVGRFLDEKVHGYAAYCELVAELRTVAAPDLAMLMVAVRNLGKLAGAG